MTTEYARKIKWGLNSKAALIIECRSEDCGALMYRVGGMRRKFGKIMRGMETLEFELQLLRGYLSKLPIKNQRAFSVFFFFVVLQLLIDGAIQTASLGRRLHAYKL